MVKITLYIQDSEVGVQIRCKADGLANDHEKHVADAILERIYATEHAPESTEEPIDTSEANGQ